MTYYYVHTKTDREGDHEVHKSSCSHLPKASHRKALGYHDNCHSAVEEAKKKGYKPANGCYWCSSECHTS